MAPAKDDVKHTVNSTWREARAVALEAEAVSLQEALDHLQDVEAACADDEALLDLMRPLAARMRSRVSEITSLAAQLRGR